MCCPLARQYFKGGGGTGRTLLLPHRRIPRVCEGATLSVAQTGDIVLIAAEVLCRRSVGGRSCEGEQLASADRTVWYMHALDFIRTELGVDHRPDNIVALHDFRCRGEKEGRKGWSETGREEVSTC